MYENWKILVVGGGTMGSSIAQVYAGAGFEVTVVDQTQAQLDGAKRRIEDSVELMLREGLADECIRERCGSFIRYRAEDELPQAAEEADLVVESVFEQADVKRAVFDKLSRYCRPDCILCSNTSASNVFEIASVENPERFLITHWFNPPYAMSLVEVVMGPHTSREVADQVCNLVRLLGKRPALLTRYVPGFIVNRMANAIMREACHMVEQGWTTPQAIDDALGATSGVRYAFEGPMALWDIVGWDITMSGARDVFPDLCNEAQCTLGQRYLDEGRLGLKAGKGAYDYTGVDVNEYMEKRSRRIFHMVHAADGLEA